MSNLDTADAKATAPPITADTTPPTPTTGPPRADVIGARAAGETGSLTVSVTIRSDETGCDQYADWWEIVTPAGELVARRILAHSHPTDNPFERSEPDVALDLETDVIIRAHMAPGGYSGDAIQGSFNSGFTTAELEDGWASSLADSPPLPEDCLF
jgi:hypothetical protein